MTSILNSVHTSTDNFQRRLVPLSVFTIIERVCRELDVMTELTPIFNSVHTSNESLHRRRVKLSVVTSIKSECIK
jgi:hypothetical protein